MSGSDEEVAARSWPRRMLRGALFVAPLFLLPIGALVLDRFGAVSLDVRIESHSRHVMMLCVYWAIATPLAALVFHPRDAVRFFRRSKAKLIALGASVLFAVVAAEIALRVLNVRAAAPKYSMVRSERFEHLNKPDFNGYSASGVRVRTNSDGFRTDHSRAGFLEHGLRIAALGDSYLFGVGVEGEATVASVVERALRRDLETDDVAVLNTGVISYSPIIQRSLFQDVVREYRPHVTFLILDCNDIGDDYKYANLNISGDPDRPLFETPERLVDWSRLAVGRLASPVIEGLGAPVRLFERLFTNRQAQRDYYEFRIEVGGVVERTHWFILRHPLEQTRQYFEQTLAYVKDIAAEARAIGSEFVLVVSPRYFHWSDRECPDNRVGFRYGNDEPYEFAYIEFFDSIVDEVPFPVFPLLPVFEASDEFPLVFSFDPHWNEAGHALVGEAIARYLLEQGLLPGHSPDRSK